MREILLREELEIPEGINIKIEDLKYKKIITVSGKQGSISREVLNNFIDIKIDNNKIIFEIKNATKKDKKDLYTIIAHLKNDFKGVTDKFTYRLRYIFVHFPMKVNIKNNYIVVENFLGGKDIKKLEIPKDIKVKIENQDIILEGHNIEELGNFAHKLEELTRILDKDLRKFQDGIYIVEKP